MSTLFRCFYRGPKAPWGRLAAQSSELFLYIEKFAIQNQRPLPEMELPLRSQEQSKRQTERTPHAGDWGFGDASDVFLYSEYRLGGGGSVVGTCRIIRKNNPKATSKCLRPEKHTSPLSHCAIFSIEPTLWYRRLHGDSPKEILSGVYELGQTRKLDFHPGWNILLSIGKERTLEAYIHES